MIKPIISDRFKAIDEQIKEFTDPAPSVTAASNKDYLHPDLWGSFCYQIALHSPDIETPCKAYGVNETLLDKLLLTPAFVARLREAKKDIKATDSTTGFQVMARSAVEKHIKTLDTIAENTANESAVRIKAIEALAKFAMLDPATNKVEQAKDKPTGIAVNFHIGGGLMPKNLGAIQVTRDEQSPPEPNPVVYIDNAS